MWYASCKARRGWEGERRRCRGACAGNPRIRYFLNILGLFYGVSVVVVLFAVFFVFVVELVVLIV